MDNSLLVELCELSHSLDKLRRYLQKSNAVLVVSRKMDAIQTSPDGREKLRDIDTSKDRKVLNQDPRLDSTIVSDESPHSKIWNLSYTLSAKRYCQEKGLALISLVRHADLYLLGHALNGERSTQFITTVLTGFLDTTPSSAQIILLCSQISKLRDHSLRGQLIRYILSKYPNQPVFLMTWQGEVQLEIYRCTKEGFILWQNKT